MENLPFKKPTPEDRALYEKWLENGGKEDPVDMDAELKKMLEGPVPQEFAENGESLWQIKNKMLGEGWECFAEIPLSAGHDVMDSQKEEPLVEKIHGQEYRKILVGDKILFFRKKNLPTR